MSATTRRWTSGLLAGLGLLAGCATASQRGETALQEGRYDEAAAQFREALAADPGRADALAGLGLAQYHLQAFEPAAGALRQAVAARPALPEARLYLALTSLALDDQAEAARQLEALAGLNLHPRIAAQVSRAGALLRRGPLPPETREFVRKSLEDEADWYRELLVARLAPHMYLGPTWFAHDPAGWSPLGWYPYGMPRP